MSAKLILEYVYQHEAERPAKRFLIQPVGGGQVVEYSWSQTLDQARRMAAHLKSQDFPAGARVAMLSKNSAHFIIAELAIWMAGGTTVAIFPTETADNIRYVLEHCEASLLFVGKLDGWEAQKSGVPEGLPCIALPLAPATGFESWDSIVARTAPLTGHPARAADELAMISYTSGSTGQPKGVMQTFKSVSQVAEAVVALFEERLGKGAENRMLSYLPLAHVYERAYVECCALVAGTTELFFAESLETFLTDLRRARPTVFLSVPRLWIKFQQGVFAKMPPQKLDRLLRIPLIGRMVARKVLTGLGLEEVKFAGSGSAPIPHEVISWYRRLGLQLLEGYAMTEDFGYSFGGTETHNDPGYCGVARPGVQVRIGEDGEVLIKSPGQLAGYYKRPDLNAECFTEDGFFHTGDLGELRADGQLRISGRKKELFKTGKGKYVAPAPIENLLNEHPLIELSMVSGVGQPAAYALVVLAEEQRHRRDDPAFRQEVEAHLSRRLEEINAQLVAHERLRMLVVASEPWTIENGCLTPTMKLKRSAIEAEVVGHLGIWYSRSGAVIWADA
jgi:long-subunit acyl-CoA synthetase (AMP-forming)